jgi:hypothetical protein
MKQVCAALAVWFCAAVPALAQDRAQLPLVGVLRIDTPATLGLTSGPLREALAALGYVDGSTIRLDFRLAEGDAGRFPSWRRRWSGTSRALSSPMVRRPRMRRRRQRTRSRSWPPPTISSPPG